MEKLQANLNQIQQYSRRENIEIIGFPDTVKQENLEETVITILKININVTPYNIVACHRLRKKKNAAAANVILRFLNRKNAIECINQSINQSIIFSHYIIYTEYIIIYSKSILHQKKIQ